MQFALEDVALCPFYGSTVKECNCLRDCLLNEILRHHLLSENLQLNYVSFNVIFIYLMHDHGILRDIFGTRSLRVKILSNSWQKAKPVNCNYFRQIKIQISEKSPGF